MAELEKIMGVSADDIEKIMGVSKDDIEKVMGVEIPSSTWYGARGVIGGGSTAGPVSQASLNRIQYKTVGATANTVDFGDLQTNRSEHQCAGSNATRGIFGGGLGLASGTSGSLVYGVTDTDYITIASTGNGTDFGDMDLQSGWGVKSGCSNGTLLFSAGGWSGVPSNEIDQMEYYTIASTGNGTDAGNLSGNRSNCAGTSGDTRYIIGGGYSDTTEASVDVMEYNDFSTSANVTDFGDLTSASHDNTSMNSSVRAVFSVPGIGSVGRTGNVLEYVTVASTGDSTDFGDLATGRGRASGTSDNILGELYGGNDGSVTNQIDKITIASTGDGTDVGDLLESAQATGSLSGNS